MPPAHENPFRTARLQTLRYRLDEGETWDDLLDCFDALGRRAALVAPDGHGKTTLLETIEPHLHARGYETRWLRLSRPGLRFVAGEPAAALRGLTARHVILFDGADLMSRHAWWWFRWRSRPAGLLITSHRYGMMPTLRECATSPSLLEALVEELEAHDYDADYAALHREHAGNLRSALWALYDRHGRR